ncbi:MAG: hypothetical protein GF316_00270 [Candidatus Lokiarchaeota archaeon]|nr:hypothetical protein [Candidatus Lokiarchaeota archaeon]
MMRVIDFLKEIINLISKNKYKIILLIVLILFCGLIFLSVFSLIICLILPEFPFCFLKGYEHEVISVSVSFLAVFIALQVYFQEERKLYWEVQDFFETIMKLIINNQKTPNIKVKYRNKLLSGKIRRDFSKYGKYLGLYKCGKGFSNFQGYHLEYDGSLENSYSEHFYNLGTLLQSEKALILPFNILLKIYSKKLK